MGGLEGYTVKRVSVSVTANWCLFFSSTSSDINQTRSKLVVGIGIYSDTINNWLQYAVGVKIEYVSHERSKSRVLDILGLPIEDRIMRADLQEDVQSWDDSFLCSTLKK